MATESDNGALYFIVGGLVVVAVIAGFLFIDNERIGDTNTPTVIERTERTIEKAVDTDNNSSSSLEMKIDENGASATTTRNE